MIKTLTPAEYVDSLRVPSGESSVKPTYPEPTLQFIDELTNSEFIAVDGVRYAAFTFNRHRLNDTERPPVVVTLPYDQGTLSRSGGTVMNALAGQLDCPVISIDLPGVGFSESPGLLSASLPKVAASRVEVLKKLGHEEVDLAGICMGGVVATHMATELGSRARRLLTYSVPGFESDFIPRICKPMEEEMRHAMAYNRDAMIEDGLTTSYFGFLTNLSHTREQRHLCSRMGIGIGLGRSALRNMNKLLHPETEWRDLVGAVDSLTDAKNHVKAVERRNQEVPGSSAVTVLEDVGHEWSRARIVLTARDAELALSVPRSEY